MMDMNETQFAKIYEALLDIKEELIKLSEAVEKKERAKK